MDELDKLKAGWNEHSQLPEFGHDEINAMLHRKSTSIIKWVFIISLIEFALGLALNFGYPSSYWGEPNWYRIFMITLDCVSYLIVIYFIYNFFKSYSAIKNNISVKAHIDAVLRSRKYVEQYIKFNIYLFLLVFFVQSIKNLPTSLDLVDFGFVEKGTASYFLVNGITYAIFLILIGSFLIWLMRLYYDLLYSRLLFKLERNKLELTDDEKESDERDDLSDTPMNRQ